MYVTDVAYMSLSLCNCCSIPHDVLLGGDMGVAYLDPDDIADVAATILTNYEKHLGSTYALTGPDSLTDNQVAALLTKVNTVRNEKITLILTCALLISMWAPKLSIKICRILISAQPT